MTILEAIVYFIVFLAMLAINARRSMGGTTQELPEEEELPPPLPAQKVKHIQQEPENEADEFEEQMIKERTTMTGMQRKLFHSPGESQAYDIKSKNRQGELRNLLTQDLKDAVILTEILGKPKGL